MDILYNEAKNEANIAKHGLSFEQVGECDWSDPFILKDNRKNYGEMRYSAFVTLRGRLCNVVFTERGGDMRVISFRKANERERKRYEKEK
jgi:uncharacterized DUF497 family protein